MFFADIIGRLKAAPTNYLDSHCALSLEVFLIGYANVDESALVHLHALLDTFPGPEQADACTRVYLSYPDTAVGAMVVLEALEQSLRLRGSAPAPGPFSDKSFIEVLRGPIVQRRPAMILGGETVVRLYNYVRGFLCGLEAVAPAEAERQTRDLAEFERWLQDWCDTPDTAWYKLLRIYGGECERGLLKFVEMWGEFEKSRNSKGLRQIN